jgi:outer membrane immunogenic protein
MMFAEQIIRYASPALALGLVGGLLSPALAADYDLPILRGSQPIQPIAPVTTVGPATFTRWSGFYGGGAPSYSDATADFSRATQPLFAFSLRNLTLEEQAHPSGIPVLDRGAALAFGYGGFLGYNTLRIIVAQAPVTVPPSGVLVTQSPAPVAVPPSGVLVTQPPAKRRTVVPAKMVQTVRTAERAAPTTMRHHVVHRRNAARRVTTRTLARENVARPVTTTRTTTVRESIPPGIVTTAAAALAATYVPVAPPYNWSGFYIGGNLGVGWNGAGSVSDTFGSTFSTTTKTQFLGGGQVGVNYEFWGGVVIGAEAMFDWLPNTQNTINATNPTLGTASATINDRWVTTATGKLGYAWDRVLLYGKGGGAWVGASSPGITVGGAPASFTSTSTNNFGWTAGVGVEWAFAGSWSARAEYDYIGLNNQSFTVAPGTVFAGDVISVNNRNIQMFAAGLNYEFGGW